MLSLSTLTCCRSANKLVEESMISANIRAGRVLKESFNQGVFNCHSGFKAEKLTDVLELVNPEAETLFTEEQIVSLKVLRLWRCWLGSLDKMLTTTTVFVNSSVQRNQQRTCATLRDGIRHLAR